MNKAKIKRCKDRDITIHCKEELDDFSTKIDEHKGLLEKQL